MTKSTYFDPSFVPKASQHFVGFPWDESKSLNVDENEIVIFEHVLRHEHFLYEQRGAVAFPKKFGVEWVDLPERDAFVPDAVLKTFKESNTYPVPIFHDSSQLVLKENANLDSIVLFSSFSSWQCLVEMGAQNSTNSALICMSGLPRYSVRKLVGILAKRLNCRVVVFADGDTWGIFICSMLLRGTLVPGEVDKLLSIGSLEFGGITGEDAVHRFASIDHPIPPIHNERIQHLRAYNCFQSKYWQLELDSMMHLERAVAIDQALSFLGPDEFSKYVLEKIAHGPK